MVLIKASLLSGLSFSASVIATPFNSLLPLSTAELCPPKYAPADLQRAIFYDFVNTFYTIGNTTEAFLTHVDESYIQHNPAILSGRDAAISALDGYFANANLTIMRTAFDSPYGWIHYRVDQKGLEPTAYIDVYRFNGSCVVEHWDVIQERPANATNPLALF
ncbi:hypothetical protein B0J12DRAFT_726768 [Macrophomina phaseolina]|nr:hypothetical protein B0J12DRAFT_726768 [Macrophomina phaseolina]